MATFLLVYFNFCEVDVHKYQQLYSACLQLKKTCFVLFSLLFFAICSQMATVFLLLTDAKQILQDLNLR